MKKGFTLVEALISISIFVVVGTLASTMYVQNVKNFKQVKVEKELLDDVQFIVERISREFQDSTIDYEEYYNRFVKSEATYGLNYGAYGARFYDGNLNTGQNPPLGDYSEGDQQSASAVCDPHGVIGGPACGAVDKDYWERSELFLITGDGSEKTMFKYEDGGALYYIKMIGVDEDDDGIFDTYSCSPETPDCTFVELSPLRTSIKRLRFYISPLEDPRRAFAEENFTVQMQPHVTLYLEVEPGDDNQGGLDKDRLPHMEVQTTLSSRVYNEVPSFAP